MSKYTYQRFNVEGIVKTAGEIAIEYGVSVDELLAMQPGDAQRFCDGTEREVDIIRL